jgi:hypothetical protein
MGTAFKWLRIRSIVVPCGLLVYMGGSEFVDQRQGLIFSRRTVAHFI